LTSKHLDIKHFDVEDFGVEEFGVGYLDVKMFDVKYLDVEGLAGQKARTTQMSRLRQIGHFESDILDKSGKAPDSIHYRYEMDNWNECDKSDIWLKSGRGGARARSWHSPCTQKFLVGNTIRMIILVFYWGNST
jgi:hypothetical protein